MDNELHLAVAITEWQVVLDHVNAMREGQISVPWIISGRLEQEQRNLIMRWRGLRGDPTHSTEGVAETVAECRRFVTENIEEVEALIAQINSTES